MNNLKDTLTTIAAVVLVAFTALKTYLDTLNGWEINWFMLVSSVTVAVIGFFTGRNHDGSKKANPTAM